MKTTIFTIALLLFSFLGVAQKSAINVKSTGNGAPIMLLPGFGCTGDVWNETVTKLSSNYQCHVVSYAGFGNISPIDTPWLSCIETEIENYIQCHQLKNVTLIGHSFGGLISMMIAKNLPKQIKRLVIVEMLPCLGQTMIPNFKPEYITFDNPYNQQLLDMNATDFEKAQIKSAQTMTNDTIKQRQITEWMLQADRKTYVYGYTEILKIDFRPEIKKIKQPTLILAAGRYLSKDQILDIYKEQYKPMKNKIITFIDNSSHFIMFDQFNIFMNEINLFLSK